MVCLRRLGAAALALLLFLGPAPRAAAESPRFKTNRQQKAYIGIQKLQQSYIFLSHFHLY